MRSSVLPLSRPGGVHAALKNRGLQTKITLVGCEQDADLISYLSSGEIVGIVAENTYRMGYEGVGLIAAYLEGRPMPPRSVIPPMLLTRQNLNSPEARLLTGVAR